MMRNFLSTPKLSPLPTSPMPNIGAQSIPEPVLEPMPELSAYEIFTGYDSDQLGDDDDDGEYDDGSAYGDDSPHDKTSTLAAVGPSTTSVPPTIPSFRVHPPPPLKRRKLDVPTRTTCQMLCEGKQKEFEKALTDIEKLIASKRQVFEAGKNGLQAYRSRAIQSCLHMVINKLHGLIDASQRAAESQGFAEKWGGRLVHQWVRRWIKERILPKSLRGHHVKVFLLLCDPAICTELCLYVRSNKWSMDPEKLAQFSQNKMVPDAAEKYARNVVDIEMPQGLKKYLEVELFPRIHLKPGRGISLRTACRWLHHKGF